MAQNDARRLHDDRASCDYGGDTVGHGEFDFGGRRSSPASFSRRSSAIALDVNCPVIDYTDNANHTWLLRGLFSAF